MDEIKTALKNEITQLLSINGKGNVKVYPRNQVAPEANYPYIVWKFNIIGSTGRNEKESLLDMEIVAINNPTAQQEAEIIADIFTIEGEGFENDTIITPDNDIALEIRLTNRDTPDTTRELIKSVTLTHTIKITDPRSVLDL